MIICITKKQAPYIHNLVDLAKRTKIDFSEDHKTLLADLTEFNLEARYPEWQKDFYTRATKNYAERYLKQTTSLQKWLKNYLKK